MMFQFHYYYKQAAPPGLYSFIPGGIRTVVSHKAGMDKQNLSMPPQESLKLTPMPFLPLCEGDRGRKCPPLAGAQGVEIFPAPRGRG